MEAEETNERKRGRGTKKEREREKTDEESNLCKNLTVFLKTQERERAYRTVRFLQTVTLRKTMRRRWKRREKRRGTVVGKDAQ